MSRLSLPSVKTRLGSFPFTTHSTKETSFIVGIFGKGEALKVCHEPK
jgi:hypothetical protein